ncbi:MAG: hypothetical protein E6R03_01610 [Hyphomicrobiaceae bacterium]|nr:MAG: hypothetical protein E6R03_01610 [Hyphomicrobiaceae bacterium]
MTTSTPSAADTREPKFIPNYLALGFLFQLLTVIGVTLIWCWFLLRNIDLVLISLAQILGLLLLAVFLFALLGWPGILLIVLYATRSES